jgi:hypothetical protein
MNRFVNLTKAFVELRLLRVVEACAPPWRLEAVENGGKRRKTAERRDSIRFAENAVGMTMEFRRIDEVLRCL